MDLEPVIYKVWEARLRNAESEAILEVQTAKMSITNQENPIDVKKLSEVSVTYILENNRLSVSQMLYLLEYLRKPYMEIDPLYFMRLRPKDLQDRKDFQVLLKDELERFGCGCVSHCDPIVNEFMTIYDLASGKTNLADVSVATVPISEPDMEIICCFGSAMVGRKICRCGSTGYEK